MKRVFVTVRGFGYIVWQARHMTYHVMIGLLWAWFLRERWGEFNMRWIVIAVFGSLLPDIDHILYFVGYGRRDPYTKEVMAMWGKHQWRELVRFLATGHKQNTSLSYHNIYVMALLAVIGIVASLVDWQAGVVLMGAMVGHFLFDIADDLIQLGGVNPNWIRWGSGRKK